MSMRRILGTTLLLAALILPTGCGSDESGPVRDPGGAQASGRPCDDGGGDCYTAPTLVSGTAAGGEVSRRATPLPDEAAVTAYAAQFSKQFAAKLTRTARQVDVPEGNTLVAAVVAIGCDVPPGADARRAGDGIEITAHEVAAPHPECFAPVTTVALAPVPGPVAG